MTISITTFKASCLQIIKQLERRTEPIEITRRGKVVARVLPPIQEDGQEIRPWERLRGSGSLLASPEESVLHDSDFAALR